MSEINNIKRSEQSAIEPKRNINTRDDSNTGKLESNEAALNSDARPNKVSLTDTATQIQSLQKAISDSSAIDQRRVDAIRETIADGSYKVDATELAQNIINFEQQLK